MANILVICMLNSNSNTIHWLSPSLCRLSCAKYSGLCVHSVNNYTESTYYLFLCVFCTVGGIWSLSAFFSADSTCWIDVGARRSVGPSDHSDWLFSWRTSAAERCRRDVLLGHWVSRVGLVCTGLKVPLLWIFENDLSCSV